MTAVRSVDSFKYAARLFAYLFVILLVGGGLLGLGAFIIESANTSLNSGITGIPDKPELAGGAVLALLGGFVLLTGLFGIVFKLIADGVDAGQAPPVAGADQSAPEADASADADHSTGRDTTPPQTGPSPGEQAARDHGSETTVPSGATSEPPKTPEPPASPEPEQERSATSGESDTEGTPTADSKNPVEEDRSATERAIEEGFGTATESTETDGFETHDSVEEPSPAVDDGDTTSAEDIQTAAADRRDQSRPEPSPEEIAFGTSPDDDDGTDDDEEPSVTDDEGDEGDEDDTDDDDEESEGLASFEELDEEGSSVDPAGDPSAGDPLADPTDDE